VISGEEVGNWERKAFAETLMGGGYQRAPEMSVFGVFVVMVEGWL